MDDLGSHCYMGNVSCPFSLVFGKIYFGGEKTSTRRNNNTDPSKSYNCFPTYAACTTACTSLQPHTHINFSMHVQFDV